MADEKEIIWRRYNLAKANWQRWRNVYDEAYAYTIPNRNPYFETSGEIGIKSLTAGQRKNIQVFDITAVISARRLASRLQKNLTPQEEHWFALEAGDSIQNDQSRQAINSILETYTDIIFKAIANSNFQVAIAEFMKDLTIGTAFMMVFEGINRDKPIIFKATSPDMVYPEENIFDEIETHYRVFSDVTESDIRRLWKNAELTEAMKIAVKTDPLKKFCMMEGVIYDDELDAYRVIVMDESTRDTIVDFHTISSPWVSARWDKAPLEIGGRGVAIEAMPTIRSLNKLVENIMRHVDLASAPPWIATTDGIFNPNDFKIAPNKVITVNPSAFNAMPFKRLDVNTDLNASSLEVNDLRQQIKECYYDQPVRKPDAPPVTATQTMIEHQAFLEDIQPAYSRLSIEFIPKLVNRIIYILQKKGYLPNDLKIDNRTVNIRYKSPLILGAEMQKVQNIMKYSEIMDSIVGPQLKLGTMNLELLPQYISERLDVFADLIKTPGEVQNLISQMQQQQQPPNPVAEGDSPDDVNEDEINQNQLKGF